MSDPDSSTRAEPPAEPLAEPISYAEWGSRFFTQAVTVERVLAGINVLSGQDIDVGPMGVGPGRLVKVSAKGAIGTATGEQVSADPVRFYCTLPVAIHFSIDLGVNKHHFDAEISVPLTITAAARADLAIVLDVVPPTPGQVQIDLTAHGLRASITQHAANVEGELKRFVSKYVARELEKPYVVKARTIDVAGAIDRAMGSLGPRREKPEEVAADFDEALEAEIRQSEQLFVDDAAGIEQDGASPS